MADFEIFDDVVNWKKDSWTWNKKSVKWAEEEWKEELLQLGDLTLEDSPTTEMAKIYEDVFVLNSLIVALL